MMPALHIVEPEEQQQNDTVASAMHQWALVINIPTELDVHLGLQTFIDLERTLVSISFSIRLQCGGTHSLIIYLMKWLIFVMVCLSTCMYICSCK